MTPITTISEKGNIQMTMYLVDHIDENNRRNDIGAVFHFNTFGYVNEDGVFDGKSPNSIEFTPEIYFVNEMPNHGNTIDILLYHKSKWRNIGWRKPKPEDNPGNIYPTQFVQGVDVEQHTQPKFHWLMPKQIIDGKNVFLAATLASDSIRRPAWIQMFPVTTKTPYGAIEKCDLKGNVTDDPRYTFHIKCKEHVDENPENAVYNLYDFEEDENDTITVYQRIYDDSLTTVNRLPVCTLTNRDNDSLIIPFDGPDAGMLPCNDIKEIYKFSKIQDKDIPAIYEGEYFSIKNLTALNESETAVQQDNDLDIECVEYIDCYPDDTDLSPEATTYNIIFYNEREELAERDGLTYGDIVDLFGEDKAVEVTKKVFLGGRNCHQIPIGNYTALTFKKIDLNNENELLSHVKKLFKVVDHPTNACGWLLRDGSCIDLSGGSDDGTRIEDHRCVKVIEGIDDIYDFMNLGNIRLMPEAPGIELSKEPSLQQIRALYRWISNETSQGNSIIIDLADETGQIKCSHEYDNPDVTKLTNQIIRYFREGTMLDDNAEIF